MRAVNLLPPELRPRIPGEGDPRIAWGVLGALAAILVLVVISISFSNRAKTINDEAAAIRAEAEQRQAAVAAIPTKKTDDVSATVVQRTLLVGGLSAVRFPWDVAMRDLSKSLPSDVTIESVNAVTAGAAGTVSSDPTSPESQLTPPTLTLTGCASGWVGYSRLMVWLRQMPGVASVKSTSSTLAQATGQESQSPEGEKKIDLTKNCGPAPLQFSLNVIYHPKSADLKGLPKPEAQPAAGGPTGATPPAAPAAQTQPGAGG